MPQKRSVEARSYIIITCDKSKTYPSNLYDSAYMIVHMIICTQVFPDVSALLAIAKIGLASSYMPQKRSVDACLCNIITCDKSKTCQYNLYDSAYEYMYLGVP